MLVGTAPEFFSYKGDKLFSIAVPVIPAGFRPSFYADAPISPAPKPSSPPQKFDVSSARAAMFPSIQLTGAGGFQSVALASFFRRRALFYNTAVSVTQPLTNEYQLKRNSTSSAPPMASIFRITARLSFPRSRTWNIP